MRQKKLAAKDEQPLVPKRDKEDHVKPIISEHFALIFGSLLTFITIGALYFVDEIEGRQALINLVPVVVALLYANKFDKTKNK